MAVYTLVRVGRRILTQTVLAEIAFDTGAFVIGVCMFGDFLFVRIFGWLLDVTLVLFGGPRRLR